MADDIQWYGERALARLERAQEAGLEALGTFFVEKIREQIETPYPPPSEPGFPPHLRSGDLWQSIGFRIVDGILEVGSTSDYARYLEEGTEFMEPRPFLSSTIEICLPEAARLFHITAISAWGN